MKYLFPISFLTVFLTACTDQPETELRNAELEGKVYFFTPKFDKDSCDFVRYPNNCYNSVYIGFRQNNTFVQVMKCGGYDATYTGEYYFRDTLQLVYKRSVINEYYYDDSDSLITRIADKGDSVQRTFSFIPDTCGTKPYFVDAVVHEYSWSIHSATHPEIYGMQDTTVSIEDIIERMKICGEWKEL